MSETCEQCLKGNHWRCRGRTCANYQAKNLRPKDVVEKRHRNGKKLDTHYVPSTPKVPDPIEPFIPPLKTDIPIHMRAAIEITIKEGRAWTLPLRMQGKMSPVERKPRVQHRSAS